MTSFKLEIKTGSDLSPKDVSSKLREIANEIDNAKTFILASDPDHIQCESYKDIKHNNIDVGFYSLIYRKFTKQ
jgi:hypothetical protein